MRYATLAIGFRILLWSTFLGGIEDMLEDEFKILLQVMRLSSCRVPSVKVCAIARHPSF